MADVKHMKWWGWGVEGVSFHHENKPAFRPFVLNAIDLDVNTNADGTDLTRRPPHSGAGDQRSVADRTDGRVGPRTWYKTILTGSCTRTARAREICCGFGRATSPRAGRRGLSRHEAEVQLIVDRAVAADAVIIPYGGGSNIAGSLHAPEDETRPVISLDLGRMNQADRH